MVHRSFNNKDDNYWALTEKKTNRTDQKSLNAQSRESVHLYVRKSAIKPKQR